MKRILITGKNSYIGTSFEKYLSKYPNDYSIDTIDLRNESWKDYNFSIYEVVFHVAGIAHVKETKKNKPLYYQVNRDLAIEVAKKAKQEKVSQFIFLSSMSVFGLDEGIIDENTPTLPKNAYGQSKLEAEQEIISLSEGFFKVAIIRPPMVYGNGCKGNYQNLYKLVKITPIFPKINNKRSMIYIDNLSEFLKVIVDRKFKGYFHPQNYEYVSTSILIASIAKNLNKKIYLIEIGDFERIFRSISVFKKVFCDLTYKNIENFDLNFLDFEMSVENTVKG